MRNPDLHILNFRDLVHLPQHLAPHVLPAQHRYSPPRDCSSFCASCEAKQGRTPRRPYRMSHGADTGDIEQALGIPMPRPERGFIDTPVMFLGLEPGGDYGNDELLQHPTFPDVRKRVPVRHYYWTPAAMSSWPTRPRDVSSVPGPLFAFLLARFGLRSAYFTNIVKCRLWDDEAGQGKGGEVDIKPDKKHVLIDSRIRRNCVAKFLRREIDLHAARVVFVFGKRALEILADEPLIDGTLLTPLEHYSVVNRNLKTVYQYASECEATVHSEMRRRGIS